MVLVIESEFAMQTCLCDAYEINATTAGKMIEVVTFVRREPALNTTTPN